MSSITGRDPYIIQTYPLTNVLQGGATNPMLGFVTSPGSSPLLSRTQTNIPISNAVMSGALPYYDRSALQTGTLDFLTSMQKRGIQAINPPPAFRPTNPFTPLVSTVSGEPPKDRTWLWILLGSVAVLIILTLVYFFYIRKR